ncbi:MAG TPA: hypothetical protein VN665_01790 [Candidatus Paceibacterota bacterium]|nr:hypothetical protein [Candidatus Paceibacterota bacterium]
MSHHSSTLTFAPKRAPWFGGVVALLILVLIAYTLMVYFQIQKPQTAARQSAAAINAVAIPSVQDTGAVSNGVTTLTHVFHVPGAYNSGVVPPPITAPLPIIQ